MMTKHIYSFLLLLLLLITTGPVSSDNYAVLIGVSKYIYFGGLELKGPKNDVLLLRKGLIDKGVKPENISVLADQVVYSTALPTKTNILHEFSEIQKKISSEDNVWISFSGHGTQQVITDEKQSHEEDGLDEVFLPIDVRSGELKGDNTLVDDEIGILVNKIAVKANHVFVVFDFCHSGTALRSDSEVNYRNVPPEVLIDQSGKADISKVFRQGKSVFSSDSRFTQYPNVVALYATRPEQRAPEYPRKINLTGDIEWGWVGQLSYTLSDALQQESISTYADLIRFINKRYSDEELSSGGNRVLPEPFLEGDMSTMVLW